VAEATREEKYACAKRELAMRRSVYPNWVSRGKMRAAEAEREIRVMEAIVADYAPPTMPDLFSRGDADDHAAA
jgi:hypothetical protein